jgi:hypothetical protein
LFPATGGIFEFRIFLLTSCLVCLPIPGREGEASLVTCYYLVLNFCKCQVIYIQVLETWGRLLSASTHLPSGIRHNVCPLSGLHILSGCIHYKKISEGKINRNVNAVAIPCPYPVTL